MVMNTASIAAKMEGSRAVHRSRFFLRFNTPGRKRILVVQWMSVDVSSEEEDARQASISKPRHRSGWGESYTRLLHEYRAGLLLSRV